MQYKLQKKLIIDCRTTQTVRAGHSSPKTQDRDLLCQIIISFVFFHYFIYQYYIYYLLDRNKHSAYIFLIIMYLSA